jgi:hypothetical protein
MATFFGMLKLGKAEDWKGLAGESKWKETRSAYKLEVGFVEKPTFLDTAVGP